MVRLSVSPLNPLVFMDSFLGKGGVCGCDVFKSFF